MAAELVLPTTEQISARLDEVTERIDAARASDQKVTILAVTKTFPVELIRRALDAGATDIGENYAQELAVKAQELGLVDAELAAIAKWHFIGGLQRNKIKMLGDTVSVWQTIDRVSLVNELAKRVPGASLFVQVNTTGEEQKSGCMPDEVTKLVDQGREAGLDVRGLMTIGPTDLSDPQRAFDALRQLAEKAGVSELSMGMSGDYEKAVRNGSTLVRVGSVLFGRRTR